MKKIFLSFIFIATLIAENNFDSFFLIFQYRNIGPTRGGRATAVEGVTKDLGTFYMGATGGGVWKTQDYGITWNNISENSKSKKQFMLFFHQWFDALMIIQLLKKLNN